MKRLPLVLVLVALLVACNQPNLSVEERESRNVGLDGFLIGMKKPVALQAAARLGATHVRPESCIAFRVTRATADSLPDFRDLDGVQILRTRHPLVAIYFSNDRVGKVFSPGTSEPFLGIRVGDQRDSVRQKLMAEIRKSDQLVITPLISFASGDHVALAAMTAEQTQALFAYDCWTFSVPRIPPAGATYETKFHEGALERVTYRRPRVNIK